MTDTMREKFEKFCAERFYGDGRVSLSELDCKWYGEEIEEIRLIWQAAQADARALVGELVRNWFALNNHGGVEVSAAGDDAAKVWNSMCQTIDKAQAFMEGK